MSFNFLSFIGLVSSSLKNLKTLTVCLMPSALGLLTLDSHLVGGAGGRARARETLVSILNKGLFRYTGFQYTLLMVDYDTLC